MLNDEILHLTPYNEKTGEIISNTNNEAAKAKNTNTLKVKDELIAIKTLLNHVESKIKKIEQGDVSITTPIVDNTLFLTTDKYQKTTMNNNTIIVLPNVDNFTEIHLRFNITEELTLILPKIKWQSNIVIDVNTMYEFIFTYDDEWFGGCISYV